MAQAFKTARSALHAMLLLAGFWLLQAVPAWAEPVKLMMLGSRLAPVSGVSHEETYAAQLEKALQLKGHDVIIIDNSVTDETVARARARLAWLLAEPADGAILELGANDGTQGVASDEIEFNLDAILRTLRMRKLPVLLIGTHPPAAAPTDYAQAYETLFASLAVQYDTVFYPYALDGVAGNPRLMQADGAHPNSEGVARIVAATLPAVEQLIANIETAKGQ